MRSSTLASFASRLSKAAAVADFATDRLGSNPAGQAAAGLTGTLGSSKGSAQVRPPTVRPLGSAGKIITKALRPARNSLKPPRASLVGGPVNLPFLARENADADKQVSLLVAVLFQHSRACTSRDCLLPLCTPVA
jgi:hypothetical protein